MGSERGAVTGIENISTAYLNMRGDSPYWSFWYNGREKAAQFNEDDVEKSLDHLSKILEAHELMGDSALYYLRIHSMSQPVYKNNMDTVVQGFPCRFHELGGADSRLSQFNGGGVYTREIQRETSPDVKELLVAIKAIPESFNQKFAEICERLDDLEEYEAPEKVKEPDMMDKITGVLQNPMIIGMVGQLIQKFIPGMAMAGPAPTVLSGAPDTGVTKEDNIDWESVDHSIDVLAKHCQLDKDLAKLAEMAENNPAMFKFLLSSLRNG